MDGLLVALCAACSAQALWDGASQLKAQSGHPQLLASPFGSRSAPAAPGHIMFCRGFSGEGDWKCGKLYRGHQTNSRRKELFSCLVSSEGHIYLLKY